jgi:Acetyltransferase (GNAT) family.
MQPVNTGEADPNNKVKSVFCFMIAPAAQRKGVATRLLERVIIDATNDGFELIETYPKKDFVSLSRDFYGARSDVQEIRFHCLFRIG